MITNGYEDKELEERNGIYRILIDVMFNSLIDLVNSG